MAGPTREQVFIALFNLLNGNIAGVVSYNRRMTLPGQIPPAQQPALIVWEQPEKTERAGPGAPKKRIWEAWVVIAFQNASKTAAGATLLNPIIDAIENLIEPTNAMPGNVQTLGGLVTGCWIAGDTMKETGDTDPNGQGGAVIPIRILVP